MDDDPTAKAIIWKGSQGSGGEGMPKQEVSFQAAVISLDPPRLPGSQGPAFGPLVLGNNMDLAFTDTIL